MKISLVILNLFLSAISCFGQELSSIHYEVENVLPSSELYDVKQDGEGFIWIASDRGVSRFDGYTFTNFTMKDGLTDNTVFNIWADKTGKIWFNTFNTRLCYYEKEIFKAYAFNDSILKYTSRIQILRTLTLVPDGSMTLGYLNGGLLPISSTGKVRKLMTEDMPGYVINSNNAGLFAVGKISTFGKPKGRLFHMEVLV